MEEYVSKIMGKKQIKEETDKAKREGKKVVFTNGCFDILHKGHIRYLDQARKYGDYLVVGLNSDSSVKKVKGRGRPLVAQKDRAELLAALCFVNGVVIFDETDPGSLIEYIRPHVLVKGGDWAEKDIVGAEFVRESGGEVKRVSFVSGSSTTGIIRKIVQAYKEGQ